jgi:hypothetical protein
VIFYTFMAGLGVAEDGRRNKDYGTEGFIAVFTCF